MRFPQISTKSLTGVEYQLPDQLPAQRTAVILAFYQRHQSDVDQWISALVAAGIPATVSGLSAEADAAVIEVPVLKRRWGPVRPLIDGGMASGIGDPDINARTWTSYTDVQQVLDALSLIGDETIIVVVAERDGTILTAHRDQPTPDSIADVLAALSQ